MTDSMRTRMTEIGQRLKKCLAMGAIMGWPKLLWPPPPPLSEFGLSDPVIALDPDPLAPRTSRERISLYGGVLKLESFDLGKWVP